MEYAFDGFWALCSIFMIFLWIFTLLDLSRRDMNGWMKKERASSGTYAEWVESTDHLYRLQQLEKKGVISEDRLSDKKADLFEE